MTPRSVFALTLVVALVLAAGALARTPFDARIGRQRSSTVDCRGSGHGTGFASQRDVNVGPFSVPGRYFRRSHWNPARRRFTTKFPAVVAGRVAVTVTVPRRLARRVALTYAHSPLSREIIFVPCSNRRRSFFPGGLVFARREPIALLVRKDGWTKPRLLRLGRFGPG